MPKLKAPKTVLAVVLAVLIAATLSSLVAASLRLGVTDSPGSPQDPASASYTLEDIYNRLYAGTAGSQRRCAKIRSHF